MAKNVSRKDSRIKRKKRVRKKILGSAESPRLSVFRSLKYTYAQIICDDTATVLAASSTKMIVEKDTSTGSRAGARALGLKIAELAKEKDIDTVVFDRNGYLYHGRVAAVAEGAREGGLKF